MVDSTIYVAARDRDERGVEAWRLSRLGADGRLGQRRGVRLAGGRGGVRIARRGARARALGAVATGAYSLHWFGTDGVRSKVVPPPAGVKPAEVAAAMAIERVRVLYYDAAGKLLENAYDAHATGRVGRIATGSGTADADHASRAVDPAGTGTRG